MNAPMNKTSATDANDAPSGSPSVNTEAANTIGEMSHSMSSIFRNIHGQDWVPPVSPPPMILGQPSLPTTSVPAFIALAPFRWLKRNRSDTEDSDSESARPKHRRH